MISQTPVSKLARLQLGIWENRTSRNQSAAPRVSIVEKTRDEAYGLSRSESIPRPA